MKQLHDQMAQWEKEQEEREKKRKDREKKQGGLDATKHQVRVSMLRSVSRGVVLLFLVTLRHMTGTV